MLDAPFPFGFYQFPIQLATPSSRIIIITTIMLDVLLPYAGWVRDETATVPTTIRLITFSILASFFQVMRTTTSCIGTACARTIDITTSRLHITSTQAAFPITLYALMLLTAQPLTHKSRMNLSILTRSGTEQLSALEGETCTVTRITVINTELCSSLGNVP